jgi:RHS repeat-associated protein
MACPSIDKYTKHTDNGNVSFRHLGFNILSEAGASTNRYDASEDQLIPTFCRKSSERFHSIRRELRPTGSQRIQMLIKPSVTITYNYPNLPSTITFANVNIIDYTYDASGKKLTTTRRLNSTTTSEIQHYLDGIEYKQQIATTNYRLEAIYHPEGRIYNTDITNLTNAAIALRHEFCIKDHLGNTRLTFTDKNNDGSIQVPSEILQENHYYPFGMNTNGPWMNDAAANDKTYQYNGKELESFGGLGWHDYGARFYDPSIGRFTTVDPMVSEFPSWTPYHYVHNNPLRYTDPTGMSANDIIIRPKKGEDHVALQTFVHLQSLTTKKLEMDSKGNVTFAASGEGNKGATAEGTDLVAGLINDKSKIVTITNDVSNTNIPTSELLTNSKTLPTDKSNISNIVGSNSTIYFSPSVKAEITKSDGTITKVGAHRVLAHELIHADHIRTGSTEQGKPPSGKGFTRDKEEQKTIMRENKMFKTQRFDGHNKTDKK